MDRLLCGFPKEARFFGGTPEYTPPPAPKAAPTVDEAAENAAKYDELKRSKGRLATMMTGPLGVSETPLVGVKTLLGS